MRLKDAEKTWTLAWTGGQELSARLAKMGLLFLECRRLDIDLMVGL